MRDQHEKITALFVKNYDEVQESQGLVPFDCKSPEERQAAIDEHFANGTQPATAEYARYLNRIIGFSEKREARLNADGKSIFSENDHDHLRAMTKVAAYSVLLTNDHESSQRVLKVGAHLFKDRGGTELMGIILKRSHVPELPDDGRMERAVAQIEQLDAAVSVQA
jgi:hypothetical protein